MNFKEMEYILAVEQEKNLTKAARKIGISQPAMSKCLRNIETELGVSLFEKISGEYIPTAAGKLFLSFAQETKEREAQFLRELQELVQFRHGTIRVGITPARSSGLTPEVLPEFRKNFPDLRLELYEEDVDRLEEMLQKGLLDVVYFVVDEDYREQLITAEELCQYQKEYESRVNEIEAQITELLYRRSLYEKDFHIDEGWEETVNKYLSKRKLTRELVEAFVSEIVFTDNNIEVKLLYDDFLKELLEVAEERGGQQWIRR